LRHARKSEVAHGISLHAFGAYWTREAELAKPALSNHHLPGSSGEMLIACRHVLHGCDPERSRGNDIVRGVLALRAGRCCRTGPSQSPVILALHTDPAIEARVGSRASADGRLQSLRRDARPLTHNLRDLLVECEGPGRACTALWRQAWLGGAQTRSSRGCSRVLDLGRRRARFYNDTDRKVVTPSPASALYAFSSDDVARQGRDQGRSTSRR
jgi:hypothetical protein